MAAQPDGHQPRTASPHPQDPPASGVGQVAEAATVVAEAVVMEAQVEGASAAAAAVEVVEVAEPDVGSANGNGAAP